MKSNPKGRLIWSLVGGLTIPTGYCFLLYFLNHTFRFIPSWASQWLAVPVIWPTYIYDILFPRDPEPVITELPGLGFWLFFIVANVLFYTFLTYLFIRWKQRMPRLR